MIGVEAGGSGPELGQHAARFHWQSGGREGVLQGTMKLCSSGSAGANLHDPLNLCRA